MALQRDPKLVGGSDVSAICSESDFRAPIDVWARMTGKPEIGNGSNDRLMMWGNLNEPGILQSLANDLNIGFAQGETVLHPEKPYCISPDGLDWDSTFYAEVKNLKWWKRANYGEPGSANIERGYYMQVQHGLGVLNDYGKANKMPGHFHKCHFRALFGGSEDVDYFIPNDVEFIGLMWQIVDDFVDRYVKPDIPPEPDASKAYQEFLRERFPAAKVDTEEKIYIDSTPELDAKMLERKRCMDEANRLQEQADQLTNEICAAIGENYGLQGAAGKFIWYPVKGRTSERVVIEELSERYKIPQNEIDGLRELCRGKEYRVARFCASKNGKS